MSMNSENMPSNIQADTTDYIEMLKHISKKWKMEFKKLIDELIDKQQNKNEVYDTEVDKLFDGNNESISRISIDDKLHTYDRDFEDIESLLKVIESKQQKLKYLNETLLVTVAKNVDVIMKSISEE